MICIVARHASKLDWPPVEVEPEPLAVVVVPPPVPSSADESSPHAGVASARSETRGGRARRELTLER
jgi:hypothetical protein